MKRSILAIGCGLAVFLVFGLLTRAIWGSPAPHSALTLLGALAGTLLAGYITAFISRRAYFAHTLVTAGLCLVVPLIVGLFTGLQRDWAQWTVGAVSGTALVTWGGLFRNWQVVRRQTGRLV